jgi:hypothetical protein
MLVVYGRPEVACRGGFAGIEGLQAVSCPQYGAVAVGGCETVAQVPALSMRQCGRKRPQRIGVAALPVMSCSTDSDNRIYPNVATKGFRQSGCVYPCMPEKA